MAVRGRQQPSPRLAVGMLAVAITAPFWVLFLLSVITTRQQAVATAVALPALAGLMWIVALLLSHRLAVESAGQRWAGQVKSVSATALLVYFVFLVPLILLAIAGHFGQGR
jgi:hypothetical protein